MTQPTPSAYDERGNQRASRQDAPRSEQPIEANPFANLPRKALGSCLHCRRKTSFTVKATRQVKSGRYLTESRQLLSGPCDSCGRNMSTIAKPGPLPGEEKTKCP